MEDELWKETHSEFVLGTLASGHGCTIKQFKTSAPAGEVTAEIAILKTLSQPNIVKLLHVATGGVAASTLFLTISRALLSSTPTPTRTVCCPLSCICRSGADC